LLIDDGQGDVDHPVGAEPCPRHGRRSPESYVS
jgi:hypothetical protein